MTTLTPYLPFDGTCRRAMEFYRSCLGGELILPVVNDTPAKEQMPASQHDKVLNARLEGSNVDISASDWLRPDRTPVRDNSACLRLSGGTFQELKSLFEKTLRGRRGHRSCEPAILWDVCALNDKFGVRWMFHTHSK